MYSKSGLLGLFGLPGLPGRCLPSQHGTCALRKSTCALRKLRFERPVFFLCCFRDPGFEAGSCHYAKLTILGLYVTLRGPDVGPPACGVYVALCGPSNAPL